MTDITQKLSELIENLKPFKAQINNQVVGYVIRADIYSRLNLNKGTERVLPSLGSIVGVPVYPDYDQQEECLEFRDATALKLYLNRKTDPQAWNDYLLSIVSPETYFT